MLAGEGIKAVAVMWTMTFLSSILAPLRLYTRIYIIKAVGVDDHIFNLAWVCAPKPDPNPGPLMVGFRSFYFSIPSSSPSPECMGLANP